MTQRIILSITILTLMAALVGGATASWFSEGSEALNIFTAGTVEVSTGEVIVTSGANPNLIPGECSTVTWRITNTGSKRVYLRVRKIDGWNGDLQCNYETAWGEGTPGLVGWGMYFDYKIDAPAKTVNLIAGQYWNAGTVTVWNDKKNLFVRYNTTVDWPMNKTDLYVGTSRPLGYSPGQFPYKHGNLNGVFQDLYIIPNTWKKNATIYIAAHADVGKCLEPQTVTWRLAETSSGWTYKESDGYWYYCQHPVEPGSQVSIVFYVCLEGESSPGREYFFNLNVEAVQVSNNAIDYLWPENPCE